MKKQLNEIKRMQLLAGLITESQLNENKNLGPDDFDTFKWKNQPLNPNAKLEDLENADTVSKGDFWKSDIIGNEDSTPSYGGEDNGVWTFVWDSGEISGFIEGEDFTFEEDDYDYNDYDLDIEFQNAPDEAPYEKVLDIMKSYEDESVLNDFKAEFPEGKPVKKKDYSNFGGVTLIDDMSEISFIQANWINMFDKDVYKKAGLI